MRQARIVLALIVFIALFGGFYYYEEVVLVEREDAQQTAGLLISIDPGAVTRLDIKNPKGEDLTAVKKNGQWRIVNPSNVDADNESVTDVINTAARLTSEKTIGKVSNPAEYGFDNPTIVTFTQKGGAGDQTLTVGGKNPQDNKYYIRAGADPDVYMVKQWQIGDIVKNEFDLRNRNIFKVAVDSVKEIEYKFRDLLVKAEKDKEGDWKLLSPIKTDADDNVVRKLIEKFNLILVAGFVDDDAEELAKYGVDDPEISLAAVYGDKEQRISLMVGSKTGEDNRLAMIEGTKQVVRIPGSDIRSLPETLDNFRERFIVPVSPGDVKAISITRRGQGAFSMKSGRVKSDDKDKVEGDLEWRIVEPINVKADIVQVAGFLQDLKQSLALEFVHEGEVDPAQFGFDNPLLVLNIETKTGKKYELKFSDTHDKDDFQYFVWVNGRPEVVTMDFKVYEKLDMTMKDMRDRKLFRVKSDNVGKITITRLGEVFEAAKSGNDYMLNKPDSARITAKLWNKFLWDVIGMKFEETADKGSGFDKPTLSLSVYDPAGTLLDTVVVGAYIETEKLYYAKTVKGGGVYKIGDEFVTSTIIRALENLMGKGPDLGKRMPGLHGGR